MAPSVAPTLIEDHLLSSADPVEAARQHVAERAFVDGPVGRVGLELELHLVDLAEPARRPEWAEVRALADALPPMPHASAVTLEPGGQIELSTPPGADVATAVAMLRGDRAALSGALAAAGFGAAPLGTDPARPVRRVNPGARYVAMERHFDALGESGPGMEMMTATASLQVNLDAGPEAGWESRLGLVRALVPMLVAASSTSPYLAGRTSGWHSMRQGTWAGIDNGRSDPFSLGRPADAWAFYALSAPVMMVRDPDSGAMTALTERVCFAEWLRGKAPIARPPTSADLDLHLSTLFPPVRPRGYIEIRCVDALPDRWWPAMAALVTVLMDDPVAADEAAAACLPVQDDWEAAARSGLTDRAIRAAVLSCVDVAARRCPEPLKEEVEEFAELLTSGRSPSDLLRARIDEVGALALLAEEARA